MVLTILVMFLPIQMHKHSQELGSSHEMMNDEPYSSSGENDLLMEMDEPMDEDDYHFQTKQINILAQTGKSHTYNFFFY